MINQKLLLKITEKWPVKVLSVAAALVLSIFFRMTTLETRFFSAPLRIETNENLIAVNSLTSSVRISLRGESDGIQPILEEDIEVFIDLERYTNEGTYRVPVQILKKGSALGVAPLEISVLPIEITVTLEQKVRKSVPIYPVFFGTIAQGYELASHQIIPEVIIAEGPRSHIEELLEFNTEIIDLDKRYENFSVRINIVNNNPLIIIHGDRMIEYRGTINRIVRDNLQNGERLRERNQNNGITPNNGITSEQQISESEKNENVSGDE